VRLAALGAALVTTAASGVLGQQPRFRTEVDLVNVAVMVMDRQGNFISNLKSDDFALYEDGARQEVTHFLRGDTDADALNLRLGLLLDTSGSMHEDIALARTAAIRFLKELPEAHDITLVDFDTEVRVARYGMADLPRLIERIRTRKTDGWTALYDALGIYLDGVQGLDGRKIMVVYTDGGDTRSAQTFSDVFDMLKASDVIVYGIGFLQHQPTSVRNEQKMRLQQLADVTGGQTFFPTSSKSLVQVFDQIAAQVRAQYSLGFVSSNTAQDGRWRNVEVRLTPAHLQALRVRARKGYYAPLKDLRLTVVPTRPRSQ
jgi:Ca-activated chloride channel homolog